MKQYFVPALVFATVLAASPIPLPALAVDVPEHRMADARAAQSQHPAEDILIESRAQDTLRIGLFTPKEIENANDD